MPAQTVQNNTEKTEMPKKQVRQPKQDNLTKSSSASAEKKPRAQKVRTKETTQNAAPRKAAKPASSARRAFATEESSRALYREVFRSARMGIDAIEYVKPLVEDRSLKTLLTRQQRAYLALTKEIELNADRLGADLDTVGLMDKAMVWISSRLNTLTDKSASRIAELMIQGTNMGIIAVTKALNAAPERVDTTLSDRLMDIYRYNLEAFKIYL